MKKRFWLLYAAYAAAVIGLCAWRFRDYSISFTPVKPYLHPGAPVSDRTVTAEASEPAPAPESVPETTAPAETLPAETAAPEETEPAITFPLDLNAADAEGLSQIPGIGPVTAEAIIAYRTEHGGFRSREELLNVHGIGEVRYRELLDYLYLPQEEAPGPAEDSKPDEPAPEASAPEEPEIPVINLNTATFEQLMLLPGCTETLAENILYLRDEQIHLFHNPLEITMAEGMTDALYLAWKPYLAVDNEDGTQIPLSPEQTGG